MLKRRAVHLWALGPSLDLDPVGGSKWYVILVQPSVRIRGLVICNPKDLEMIRLRISYHRTRVLEL